MKMLPRSHCNSQTNILLKIENVKVEFYPYWLLNVQS